MRRIVSSCVWRMFAIAAEATASAATSASSMICVIVAACRQRQAFACLRVTSATLNCDFVEVLGCGVHGAGCALAYCGRSCVVKERCTRTINSSINCLQLKFSNKCKNSNNKNLNKPYRVSK